jgi:hypothetical protein
MTPRRTAFLLTAAVIVVTAAGFAWSEKASSGIRPNASVSGQCPMSGGGDAASCPYLRGKAGASAESGATGGNGCPRMGKDVHKGAGDASGVCPHSGKSGSVDIEGVRRTVKRGLRSV